MVKMSPYCWWHRTMSPTGSVEIALSRGSRPSTGTRCQPGNADGGGAAPPDRVLCQMRALRRRLELAGSFARDRIAERVRAAVFWKVSARLTMAGLLSALDGEAFLRVEHSSIEANGDRAGAMPSRRTPLLRRRRLSRSAG